jgi:hypothetical protein
MVPTALLALLAVCLATSRLQLCAAAAVNAVEAPTVKTTIDLGDTSSTAQCSSELDCSLLGACSDGVCKCDAGWGGSDCARMQLAPVRFPQGYGMVPALQADVNTSWGGDVILADGQYHML